MNKQELLTSLKDTKSIVNEIASRADDVFDETRNLIEQLQSCEYIDINHFKYKLQLAGLYSDELKEFIDNYLRFEV